jgi:glycosyltransferase involved in cell wall biosynthesis
MYNNGRICRKRCFRCKVFCWPKFRLSGSVGELTSVSRRLLERIQSAGQFVGHRHARTIYNCNEFPCAVDPRPGPAPGVPLRVGFLGRIELVKGLHILLEAACSIGPAHLRVLIGGVGKTAYSENLKIQFKPPLANFLGRVTAADFFKQIDILVMPSILEEPAGRVLHEAYSFGVPVIGIRLGGMPELVTDGVTGYLASAPTAEALELILNRLVVSPPDWLELSKACLHEAERFDLNLTLTQYWDAWEEVLGRSTAGRASA